MRYLLSIPMSFFRILLITCLISPVAAAEVDFSRDIRPLLSDRCFKCHGYDDETREAELGLHLFPEATRDLGGYQAIKPGHPEESEILTRLTSDDPDEVMPPAVANKPRFSEEEVALIRQWIEQGAEYETHWAFVPPKKPDLPEGEKSAVHPVDQFLDATIRQQELKRTEAANPSTLIRRLSYDLRGLPPTIDETDAFLLAFAEEPAVAWESVVDAFLGSPAYGERWAREWLDLARYADSNGYEKDRPRSIWPYRDWVIRALNADMPYDQFTIEQLAGDMLPDPTTDQLVATGFHRNTMLNEEGGIDPLEYRYHAMVDRVATTGTVWMGLTTGCAQCHTHKFDPILHTDYYSLMALLDNADEPDIAVPVPDTVKKRADIQKRMAGLETAAFASIDETKYATWLAEREKAAVDWTPLRPTELKADLPYLEILEDDYSILATGDITKREVYELAFDTGSIIKPITAIRIEAIPDERLPGNGPGTAFYEGRTGDFYLSEVDAQLGDSEIEFSDSSISLGRLAVTKGQERNRAVFDGEGSSGWSTTNREGERSEIVLNLGKPIDPKGADLQLKLLFERHYVAALGRFRISVTTDEGTVAANNSGAPNPHVAEDIEMRRAYVRVAPEFEQEQISIADLEKEMPELPTTLVMRERPPENPRVTHLHHRGEYLQPKQVVPAAVPAFLEPIPEGEPNNRLGFARWLVSERNPLSARVAVNRAWREFFGTGIVKTSGDFGYQSESPSHPELLDWLAVSLVENGWSMKQLHRSIVTSEAYRRDSGIDSTQLEKDPDNRYLARGPRFRLDAEMIRDGALAVSGLLTGKIGGPSVFPLQPPSVVDMAYGNGKWTTSTGDDRYRRSLYTFAKRTAPFAAYLTFDGPTGESCLPRREISNTPLQALTLLNDPMFAEAAEALANSTGLSDGPNPVGFRPVGHRLVKLNEMFQRILSRPPTEAEQVDFLAFFEEQKARIAVGALNPGELVEGNNPELAAWKMVARVLLNLNEAITKG